MLERSWAHESTPERRAARKLYDGIVELMRADGDICDGHLVFLHDLEDAIIRYIETEGCYCLVEEEL